MKGDPGRVDTEFVGGVGAIAGPEFGGLTGGGPDVENAVVDGAGFGTVAAVHVGRFLFQASITALSHSSIAFL